DESRDAGKSGGGRGTMNARDARTQQGGCMYWSMWSLCVACALAALLSAGCRETSEHATAHETGAAPAATTRTTGRANQEGQHQTHDVGTAPHTHGEDGVQLSAAAKANLNLQVVEASTQTLERVLKIPGVVRAQPDRVAVVTPRLAARIEKVYVN